MRKKIFIVLVFFALLNVASIGIVLLSATASKQIELPEYEPVDFGNPLGGDVFMPELGSSPIASFAGQQLGLSMSTPPVGTVAWDWYALAASGNPNLHLRAVSEFAEVWVAEELGFWGIPDDPRMNDPTNIEITDEMCQYLADQFDSVIYSTCTEFFGAPFDRNGTGTIFEAIWPTFPERWDWINAVDNPQRVIIKVLNIVDDNYFDPTYPYYVIGFYSSLYTNDYYMRNMIHLDCWRWWQRLGPEEYKWLPAHPELNVTRPYTYEGTTAHEYQHNIHDHRQPFDESFMNEGCSMFAESVCGYGTDYSSINSFLATPDNSLTIWGDQGDINILADYGQALLWCTYLNDQYSSSTEQFLSHYMYAGIPSIDGINAAIAYFGSDHTFDDAFHNWRLANLIRSDFPGHGIYNYKTIDMSLADPVRIYEVEGSTVDPTRGTDFGNTITILGYDTGVELVGSYGTDYISFTELRNFVKLNFDGDDTAFLGWRYTGDGFWWTGMAPWLDTNLIGEAFIDPEDPILTIHTYYDIEYAWDYGFVQVYNETSGMWQSLENAYTTYYTESVFPFITENLPGLSGEVDDWVTMDFDLTAFAGELGATVQIRFRYMTDPYVTLPGWFIEWATVSGTPVELEVADIYPSADFMVSVVYRIDAEHHGKEFYIHHISDMKLNEFFEGTKYLYGFKHADILLVVSPIMYEGEADYSFNVEKLNCRRHF